MKALNQLHKGLYKADYYLRGYLRLLQPGLYGRHKFSHLLVEFERLDEAKKAEILRRVNYYNKLDTPFKLDACAPAGCDLVARGKSAAYYIDYSSLLNFFPKAWRAEYLLGDITQVPDVPSFLKSRPVCDGQGNANSVLLKLNQIRHYYFVKDKVSFDDKLPRVMWRGKTTQIERLEFLKKFCVNPLCDIGDTYKKTRGSPYHKPFMSISEQLAYRYVLSIEGYDVATNTKWIMASNSLCLMRKPRFETWFMEGSLIPDFHYVLLKDDYSDFEEKITFYNENPEQAKAIIANANRYVEQFSNQRQELMIALLVMHKYFTLSGQA